MHASSTRTRDLSYIALGVALLAICSSITIPMPIGVPFTMQTFAIFVILSHLGGKTGTLAILCYLIMGAVGLPIFSGFQGGISKLLGTTGGYLAGFLATGLIYWFCTKVLGDKLWTQILGMVLGLAVLYALGTLWFMQVYLQSTGAIELYTVLSWCVLPYIIPDLLKMSLALLVSRRIAPRKTGISKA